SPEAKSLDSPVTEKGAAKEPLLRPVVDPLRLGPAAIQERSLWAASLMGFGVGFGTGFLYGGDHIQGFVFAAVDAVFWAGLTGAVVAFNQLVARNDLRSGQSLASGERGFGERENSLYLASFGLVGLLVASHLYQGVA